MCKLPDMSKVSDLVGAPFEYGGRGPKSYDCYGLVKEVYARSDIQLQDYMTPCKKDDPFRFAKFARSIDDRLFQWKKIDKPLIGCVVRLKVFGYSCHLGIVTKYQKMYHAWDLSGGVIREDLKNWERRILGYYVYE